MRRGWFDIPGEQSGERTVAEQLKGVEPALSSCAGKTVLDLGCAEGMISKAFLDRGASAVLGVEWNESFFERAAAKICDPRMLFMRRDLNEMDAAFRDRAPSDIVLALAIVHKLRDPGAALTAFAGFSRERLVIRLPLGSDGVLRWKHGRTNCDSREVMPRCGFRLEQVLPGPRGERVQHWIREA